MKDFCFAHISDVHLGAFREPELRELNCRAFELALDGCGEADFVIIAGDLFDSPLPDLGVANRAVRALRRLRDQGKRVYAVYGSHDYSPAEKNLIDVLESAGLLSKVSLGDYEGERLKLSFAEDKETGARLTGLDARKRGIEREHFEALDRASLEAGVGYKIFVFHSGVEEHKPDFLKGVDGVPLSLFPKGFDYYAGGHVHERIETTEKNYGKIVFPGPLFAADYRDLEDLSKKEHGFYLVRVNNGKTTTEFKPVNAAQAIAVEADANEKSPAQVREALLEKARACKCAGKIVLLKVHGTLASGNPGEIEFNSIAAAFTGALAVKVNRAGLSSPESAAFKVEGENKREVEEKLFEELSCGKWNTAPALPLLDALKEAKPEGETRTDFEARVTAKAAKALEAL
ncbi:MAG: DNA repair exonuclease [Candidatus Micrarchaeia archaeon]